MSIVAAMSVPALPACVVHNDVAPGRGTLVVDWTIDDSKSADGCNATQATSIEVSVFTESGADVGVFEASCAAFSIDVDLVPGRYTANAVLLDATNRPRTTSIAIHPFVIYGGDNLDVPIDFPHGSFL